LLRPGNDEKRNETTKAPDNIVTRRRYVTGVTFM
jgi:hypothetical protein